VVVLESPVSLGIFCKQQWEPCIMLTPEVLSEPGMRSMKKQVPDDNIPTREIP